MVHQINSLYEVLKLKQSFWKNKVVTGKAPFFVISPFCTPHSICLNVGFLEAATRGVLCKKVFLEISQNSQENTCTRVATLLKKRLWHKCFPVNIAKFLRTSFLQNTSGRVLLASDRSDLYRNFALTIVVLSTKKLYPSFLKTVYVFQNICFKVKVLKMFKITSDWHIKTCRPLKWRANLKIPSIIF